MSRLSDPADCFIIDVIIVYVRAGCIPPVGGEGRDSDTSLFASKGRTAYLVLTYLTYLKHVHISDCWKNHIIMALVSFIVLQPD